MLFDLDVELLRAQARGEHGLVDVGAGIAGPGLLAVVADQRDREPIRGLPQQRQAGLGNSARTTASTDYPTIPVRPPLKPTISFGSVSKYSYASNDSESSLSKYEDSSVAIEEDDCGMGDIDGYTSDEVIEQSENSFTKSHPTAGKTYGKGRTILQDIEERDQYIEDRKTNPFFPFRSRQDFEMGAWLSQSNASMSQIDAFLKLGFVRSHSFKSRIL